MTMPQNFVSLQVKERHARLTFGKQSVHSFPMQVSALLALQTCETGKNKEA